MVPAARILSGPPKFAPSSVITDEEAGAMFRAVANLFGLWKVTDKQAAVLLDLSVRSYAMEGGGKASWNRDLKARLSNLMGIQQGAEDRFPRTPARLDWVRAPNNAFGDRSALDVMLDGNLTDLMRVRRYLEQRARRLVARI